MLSLKDECRAMGVSVKEYFAIRRLLEIANGRQMDDETKNRVVATVENRFPEIVVFLDSSGNRNHGRIVGRPQVFEVANSGTAAKGEI